jgi:hypothetical protein
MYSIELVLPILQRLDGATLSPDTFRSACATAGWPEPVDDGIGLWETEHPSDGTPLVLDTVTKPSTLICRLDSHDDYEPAALRSGALRDRFDANFARSRDLIASLFPVALAERTYAAPHNWRFVHFAGESSLIALEQTYYDPVMGVQLLLLVQPLPAAPSESPVTSTW